MEWTREEYIILILLVLNAVAALICLIWNKIRGTKQHWVKFFIMLICPVAGFLYFVLSWLFCKIASGVGMGIDLKDVIFGKDRVKTQIKADENREKNILPLEEAVLVEDSKNQRLAMMNAIKGDISEALAAISLALGSKDSETAHYAASALGSVLNEFRITVSKMMQKLEEEEPEETQTEEELLNYMDKVLRQRVFSDLEQDRFVHIMERAAEELYKKNASRLTPEQYESVCLRLLEINDTEQSKKWCDRQAEQYPEQLSSYTCRLKLYFTLREREKFFHTMDELKKSKVVINSETLEIIRIFSRGRAS